MNVRISFEPQYYTRTPEGKRNIECLDGVVSFYTNDIVSPGFDIKEYKDGIIGRINIKLVDHNISQTPIDGEKGLPKFYNEALSKEVVKMVQTYVSALNNEPSYVWQSIIDNDTLERLEHEDFG